MSIHVLDTKKWSVSQALLVASEMNSEAIFIVSVNSDGVWDSLSGGEHKTPALLLAAEVLRRRAFQSLEGW